MSSVVCQTVLIVDRWCSAITSAPTAPAPTASLQAAFFEAVAVLTDVDDNMAHQPCDPGQTVDRNCLWKTEIVVRGLAVVEIPSSSSCLMFVINYFCIPYFLSPPWEFKKYSGTNSPHTCYHVMCPLPSMVVIHSCFELSKQQFPTLDGVGSR